jgi:uncharacterized membrane protein YheB (UPF0754 family)
MKKVTQKLPRKQVDIIIESLDLLGLVLNKISNVDNPDLEHKLFDIMTLKAMLNSGDLVVNIDFKTYENFTSLNGIDFPEYVK